MVFKNLPLSVQNFILDKMDIESLIQIMSIDRELSPFAREKVFNYLLKNSLQAIVIKNYPEKLIEWKKYIYDALPIGDKRRKVLVAALFYLLGKYPKVNVEEYVYIFNGVIDTEFMLYKCLGLSHQEGYTFPFCDYFRLDISKEAQKDELVNNKLFEEITGFKTRKIELEGSKDL